MSELCKAPLDISSPRFFVWVFVSASCLFQLVSPLQAAVMLNNCRWVFLASTLDTGLSQWACSTSGQIEVSPGYKLFQGVYGYVREWQFSENEHLGTFNPVCLLGWLLLFTGTVVCKAYVFVLIFIYWLMREEGGKEKHRFVAHLFTHSLVDFCVCSDWGSNPQTWLTRTKLYQLSYLAKKADFFLRLWNWADDQVKTLQTLLFLARFITFSWIKGLLQVFH